MAPIGPTAYEQILWLIRKENGRMRPKSLGPVRFVPLVSPLLDDPAQRISHISG